MTDEHLKEMFDRITVDALADLLTEAIYHDEAVMLGRLHMKSEYRERVKATLMGFVLEQRTKEYRALDYAKHLLSIVRAAVTDEEAIDAITEGLLKIQDAIGEIPAVVSVSRSKRRTARMVTYVTDEFIESFGPKDAIQIIAAEHAVAFKKLQDKEEKPKT